MGPHPAVAAVRHSVRRALAGLEPGALALVACSGGADSLALAAALAFEAPRLSLRGGGVTVDHGLQPGSADQAARVTAALAELGLAPVRSVQVSVPSRDGPEPFPGPEAAARAARYAALDRVAAETGAAAILLGHTLDDQAETVLLGLARGSGARSLAGMPERSGRYLRPFLGLRRAQTRAACSALGLEPWDDPQNSDPGYLRVRVRHQVLPVLEQVMGPGVAEALARTSALLRADAEVLDALATTEAERTSAGHSTLDARELSGLPAAIRRRVLRLAALAAGCPAGSLAERHVAAIDALVTDWHGQRGADLPGGVHAERSCGRLTFTAAGRADAAGRGPQGGGADREPEDLGGRERPGQRTGAGPDHSRAATAARRRARRPD
jgi:tRNA(Ile)-lysidine synthase